MPTTGQLSPPIIHARFTQGVLRWQLQRGAEVDRHRGEIPITARDPLATLRAIELRMGAAGVRFDESFLSPAEVAYAQARGWEIA